MVRALSSLVLAVFALAGAVATPAGASVADGGGGVRSEWLPNGIRLHVRSIHGAPRTAAVLTIAGGAVLEGPGERGLTEAAAWSWARATAGDEGEGEAGAAARRIRVDPSPEGVAIRASCARGDLAGLLKGISAMLAAPEIDTRRLERWRGRSLRVLAEGPGSAERTVAVAIMELLVPEQVPGARRPADQAQIAAIDAARARQWLRERVAPAPIEVAIAGDIGGDECIAILRGELGSLPDRERVSPGLFREQRKAHRPAGPISTRVELELPRGGAHVIAGFSGPDIGELDEVRALNLAAEVAKRRLDGLCNDGRLAASQCSVRLMPARTHPGLGAMFVMTRVPDDDETVNAALVALQLMLDDLLIEGPRPEELGAAASTLADESKRRLDEPEYWASCLSIATLQGFDPAALEDAPQAYLAISRQRVHDVVRRWCVPRNRFSLVARPRAGEGDGATRAEGP